MCGIAGVYYFNASGEISSEKLNNVNKAMKHRGPDGEGVFIAPGVALSHVRLSIIDTSTAAKQPMQNSSGRFTISFNGEIFNYQLLRTKLAEQGNTFKTNSDTEVLLQLFEKHGKEMLPMLNGFFAFAIYDREEHSIFIARDRFGEKPLYYCMNEENKMICFSSELRNVIHLMPHSPSLNEEALHEYLHYNYIPAPLTICNGIQKLIPGTFLEIKHGNIVHEKFYVLKNNPVKHPQANAIAHQLEEKTKLAVERRMVSDVPVGAFLSGGVDSSIVSALAVKLNPDIETFSLGFKANHFFDESNYAEQVARHIGTNHHSIYVHEDDLLQNVTELIELTDEPFADSSSIALYSLCKSLKGKYKVMLSGDGADEIFGGYNKHIAEINIRQKNFKNRLIKNLGWSAGWLPQSRNSKWGNKARQLIKYSKGLKLNAQQRYQYLAGFNPDEKYGDLLLVNPVYRKPVHADSSDDFNVYLMNDVELVLTNDMLYKVDSCSMYNSVEVRSPFLDHELIEFAFTIPAELKTDTSQGKIILKKAFEKYLPHEILYRPKHGFEVPLQQWLRGPLKSLVTDKYLNARFIHDQSLFNPDSIERLKKKLFSRNPGDAHATVWALMLFQSFWIKNLKR